MTGFAPLPAPLQKIAEPLEPVSLWPRVPGGIRRKRRKSATLQRPEPMEPVEPNKIMKLARAKGCNPFRLTPPPCFAICATICIAVFRLKETRY